MACRKKIMAISKHSTIAIFVLFIGVPIVATTNIDCGGKSFYCVNSTHFLICVELIEGVSTTIDSVEIPCPPSTMCRRTNIVECELPQVSEVLSTTSESSAVEVFPSTTVTEPGAAKLIDPTVETGTPNTTESNLININKSGINVPNDMTWQEEKNLNSLFVPYTEKATINQNIFDNMQFENTTEYIDFNVGNISASQNDTDNLSIGFQLNVNSNIIDFTTMNPINDFFSESNHTTVDENNSNIQFENTTGYIDFNSRVIGAIQNDTDNLSAGFQLDVNSNVIDITTMNPINDVLSENDFLNTVINEIKFKHNLTANQNITDNMQFENTTEYTYFNSGSIDSIQNDTNNPSAGLQLDVNSNVMDTTTFKPINDFLSESNNTTGNKNKTIYNNSELSEIDKKMYSNNNQVTLNVTTIDGVTENDTIYDESTTTIIDTLQISENSSQSIHQNLSNNVNNTDDQLNDNINFINLHDTMYTSVGDNVFDTTTLNGASGNILESISDEHMMNDSGLLHKPNKIFNATPKTNILNVSNTNKISNSFNNSHIISVLESPISVDESFNDTPNLSLPNISVIDAVTELGTIDMTTEKYDEIILNHKSEHRNVINLTDFESKVEPLNNSSNIKVNITSSNSNGFFQLQNNLYDTSTSSNPLLNAEMETSIQTEKRIFDSNANSNIRSKAETKYDSYYNDNVFNGTDTKSISEKITENSTHANNIINNIFENHTTITAFGWENTSLYNNTEAPFKKQSFEDASESLSNNHSRIIIDLRIDENQSSKIMADSDGVYKSDNSTVKKGNEKNELVVNEINLKEQQTNRNIILSNIYSNMTDATTLKTVSTNFISNQLPETNVTEIVLATIVDKQTVSFEIPTSSPEIVVTEDFTKPYTSESIPVSTNKNINLNITTSEKPLLSEVSLKLTNPQSTLIGNDSSNSFINTESLINNTSKLYTNVPNGISKNVLEKTEPNNVFESNNNNKYSSTKSIIETTTQYYSTDDITTTTMTHDGNKQIKKSNYVNDNNLKVTTKTQIESIITKGVPENNTIIKGSKENVNLASFISESTDSVLQVDLTTSLNITSASIVPLNVNVAKINKTEAISNNNGMEQKYTLWLANNSNIDEQLRFSHDSRTKTVSDVADLTSIFTTTREIIPITHTTKASDKLITAVNKVDVNVTNREQFQQIKLEKISYQKVYLSTTNNNLGEITTAYPNLDEEQISTNLSMALFIFNKSRGIDISEPQNISKDYTTLPVNNRNAIPNIYTTLDESRVPINKTMDTTTTLTKNMTTYVAFPPELSSIFIKTSLNVTIQMTSFNKTVINSEKASSLTVLDTNSMQKEALNRSNIGGLPLNSKPVFRNNATATQINSTMIHNTSQKYGEEKHGKTLTNSLKIGGNILSFINNKKNNKSSTLVESYNNEATIKIINSSDFTTLTPINKPTILNVSTENNITRKVFHKTTSKEKITNLDTYNKSNWRIINPYTSHKNGPNNTTTVNILDKIINNYSTINTYNYNTLNTTSRKPIAIQNINIKFLTHFNCTSKKRGRYADRKDCRKFYICVGRLEPIIRTCPINTVFSDTTKQCTKNVTQCYTVSEFKCASAGRFTDNFNENNYYICIRRGNGFVRFKFQCQNGYQLNKSEVKCVEKRKAKESRIQSSISNDSVSLSKDIITKNTKYNGSSENLSCKEEGIFADANDCRKYYVCTKNNKSEYRRRRKNCDSDEVFHKYKKKCVDEDSYEC